MAISKQQPMRPAEIALADASNQHELTLQTHSQSLNTLTDGLAAEISTRKSTDTALGTRIDNEIQTRANGDTTLQGQIGDGFSPTFTIAQALNTTNATVSNLVSSSESLESFVNHFKIGCINNITIPANDSVSGSETFTEPFAQDDVCVLLVQVITNEPARPLTYTLIGCTYSGFSYSIANSDAEVHTVSLGYIAVKVN